MFKLKIKASTLAEAIVSLVIISIISSLALMTFVSIYNSSNNKLKILAFIELENIISHSHMNNEWTNEDYKKDNIKIEKIVEKYENKDMLLEVTYKVSSNNGKLLFERKEIIISNNNSFY